MPAPIKPKKTARNRPGAFDEMIVTPPAPSRLARTPRTRTDQASAQTAANPVLSDANIKRAIIVMWLGAVVIGGIGIGRLIVAAQQPVSYESPVPVATATVGVEGVPSTTILFARVISVDHLAVAPAVSTDQAQAGSSFKTMSVSATQGANNSDALQPGFNHMGHIQGTVGTNPTH